MSKAVARVATWLRSRLSADGGFTLVEVVISVSLLGLITGAATTSMITATNGARMTSQRAHESTDAQLISAFLVRDAQAAGGSKPAVRTRPSGLPWRRAPPTPAHLQTRVCALSGSTESTSRRTMQTRRCMRLTRQPTN
jgi:prepilin-type N-terminal cleavage/methylation domain-containing protein